VDIVGQRERTFRGRGVVLAVVSAVSVLGWVAPASAASPTLAGFTPTHGPAGTTVVISGTFTPPVSSVTFNGVAAFGTPTATTTTVTAVVPPAATTGKIAMTDAGGSAASTTNFTVDALPAPTITSISPTCGRVGDTVTLAGTNLIGTGAVTFRPNESATFTVVSSSQVTATVPAGAHDGTIRVTTSAAAGGGGGATSPRFYVSNTCPTIASFAPTSGSAGTSVVVTGTNFTGATAVAFNGVSATFTVNSATQITAKVPAGATTGKITVTTPSGVATSTNAFTVMVAAPAITSFSPTYGPVGSTVTVAGANLTGATAVTFNGVKATGFKVNKAGTQVTVTVPSRATTGKIAVTTPAGTATSTGTFTVSILHDRVLSLRLRRHLVARGRLAVADGHAACVDTVRISIQRRSDGRWRTIKRGTTNGFGRYRVGLRDVAGRFRAKAPRVVLNGGADLCSRAISPVRRHA
jgi:hypothetical protein